MDDRILQELLDEQKKTNTILIDIECYIDGIYESINSLLNILKNEKIGNNKNANAKTKKR